MARQRAARLLIVCAFALFLSWTCFKFVGKSLCLSAFVVYVQLYRERLPAYKKHESIRDNAERNYVALAYRALFRPVPKISFPALSLQRLKDVAAQNIRTDQFLKPYYDVREKMVKGSVAVLFFWVQCAEDYPL